jgi:putative sporulation protein YyaC
MNYCLENKKKTYYFNSLENLSAFHFSKALTELLQKYKKKNTKIIFLCIGSDRATGDSLGPIIGYKLTKMNYQNCLVYGTLENPVHANNLSQTIEYIREEHKDSLIVAIDASLGTKSHIGYITLGEGSLKPGSGVEKILPEVGDIHITGIVNLSGLFDNMLLQTTRLNVVMKLADCISLGIKFSMLGL